MTSATEVAATDILDGLDRAQSLIDEMDAEAEEAGSPSEKGKERLRPQSPVASFAVKDHDEVFVFDKKFDLESAPSRGPVRRGPTKIGGVTKRR